MTALNFSKPEPRQDYIRHSEVGVLVDGEDVSMDQWVEVIETGPSLMAGLAWAALLGILSGIAWGALFFYILHWA